MNYSCIKQCIAVAALLLISTFHGDAFTVKNLKAHYSHGQVFLTWHNCAATSLQYNVYRSQTKFTSVSQLNNSTYLGFVRDSSSKNFRLSTLDGVNTFYKFRDNGNPLKASKGLYTVTCTEDASFYYAVMVLDLSTGIEDKVIIEGKNSLALPAQEIVEQPLPVLQDSVETSNGEMKYRYVQFVNNQETPLYPAMNSTGSYGFLFYLVKRGDIAENNPLMVTYQSDNISADSKAGINEDEFAAGYILGPDDWLPIRYNSGKFGDNTYWCGYHEDFDIYTDQNPVPVSGVIKMYTQKRVIEAIRFVRRNFAVDSASIYLKGNSHNGYGALFTAALYPEEIAAVYGIVEPVSIGPNGVSIWEKMWGLEETQLISDVPNYKTGDPMTFNKATNIRRMAIINVDRSVPLVFDVHGKNDETDGWNLGKVQWLDTLDRFHYGGTRFWDQREHNGDGRNFTTEETLPDFTRYHADKSYPAFSNCSVNQKHGNGNKNSGDPYGAMNGYLDFEDDITDEECEYDVNVFVRDYYVGGILDPEQYNTCTADIAFRRLKHFKPENNATIKWKNYNSDNDVIQSGSFTYKNKLMIINNLTINKSGNRIELKIQNCSRGTEVAPETNQVEFIRTGSGYEAIIFSAEEERASLTLFDLSGRTIFSENLTLSRGENILKIPSPGSGIYMAEIRSNTISATGKLMF